jgi:hypothetical protein
MTQVDCAALIEPHACAVAQTLKVTPAMAAGVTDCLWEMTDLVALVEAWENSQYCAPTPRANFTLGLLLGL